MTRDTRMTTWNIGNTTVRNPARLLDGLRVFSDQMEGSQFEANAAEQERYWHGLLKAEVIESVSEDERTSQARKWYAALRQLGFVRLDDSGHVYVTAVGRALMEHPETTDLIFLRQLLKYKLESPVERTRLNGYAFRPFITLLRFLKLAHDNGLSGLTRDEVALFVVTTMTEDVTEIERIFRTKIVPFREGLEAVQGSVAKRNYTAHHFAAHGPGRPSTNTLKDYADSNARYARISGLVTQSGLEYGRSGKYKIADGRLAIVNDLLYSLAPIIPDTDYLQIFLDPEQPHLPMDDATQVAAEIAAMEERITAHGGVPAMGPTGEGVVQQHAQAKTLRLRLAELEEYEFYRQQRNEGALREVRELLEQIRTGTLPASRSYAPAFLEWALWRLLLGINDIQNAISETRGFKVDAAFVPIHHAAAGAADCTFDYVNDTVVVEATLTTSSRQVGAEGEPVRRHVAKVVQEKPDKAVLGLFVAKTIDRNTLQEFYRGDWLDQNDENMLLDIVPLTIENIIALIDAMLAQDYIMTSAQLVSLLRSLEGLRDSVANGPKWGAAIQMEFPNLIQDLRSLPA